MSRVSIILTSYNHDKYLRESIESILNQTYSDFELYILDDASTDNSWNIINSITDPRVHGFRSEINSSFDLRSITPDQIPSEYIAIHHSDDAWEPSKLEKQVEFLDNNPDVEAVFTHVQILDEESQPFTDEKHPYFKVFDQPNRSRYEWLRYFFFKGNALCHPSVVFRADSYLDFIPRKGLMQIPDLDLWVHICFRHNIHILQEKLTFFRVRENEANVSGNRPDTRIRFQFEFLQLLQRYTKISSKDELLRIFPEADQYINLQNADILFAIGMLALGLPHNEPTNTPTKLFGLNLLFEALNDAKRAKQLKEYQLFDKSSFIELTTKYDIFSVETINKLNQKLSARDQHIEQLDKSIQELNHLLSERDQHIMQLDKTIQKINQMLSERDQHIVKLDKTIQDLDQKQSERDQHIGQLNKTILELNQMQSERDQHIVRLDKTIRDLNDVIEEKDHSIQDLNSKIIEHNKSIHDLRLSLDEREIFIQDLNLNLDERNNSIQALNSEIIERDKSIEELNLMLVERHKLNQNLNETLADREKSIQDLNSKADQLDQEILYYARSKSWRITRPLRKLKRMISGKNDN